MSGDPPRTSWGRAVFEQIYADSDDPWRFESSAYERAKYDATIAALPPRRYFTTCLEIGCSIGVQTRRLAERCDSVLSLDIAEAALVRARWNCADLANVGFAMAQVPKDWPEGEYDLIVLSEILYFLDAGDLDHLSARILQSLRADGVVLLVNWTGETDTPSTGDQAATHLIDSTAPHLTPTLHLRGTTYRIDRLQRAAGT